jgi:predicted nuclease of predicted toxin-antitoxin system
VIKLVVDISLSPAWVDVLAKHGWSAVHWSAIGDPRAKDRTIMEWARENQHVVFTHDLDFGTLLAFTRSAGPSVIQARAHDVLPEHLENVVVEAMRRYLNELEQGAIVTVDELRAKVRVLPIGSTNRNV